MLYYDITIKIDSVRARVYTVIERGESIALAYTSVAQPCEK